MLTHRANATAVVLNNKLIVIGGHTGFQTTASVESYDLLQPTETGVWKRLPDCLVWSPRAVVVNNQLLVLGFDENLWFDFPANKWEPFPKLIASHNRRDFTAVVV